MGARAVGTALKGTLGEGSVCVSTSVELADPEVLLVARLPRHTLQTVGKNPERVAPARLAPNELSVAAR